MVQQRVDGFLVMASSLTFSTRSFLAALATQAPVTQHVWNEGRLWKQAVS